MKPNSDSTDTTTTTSTPSDTPCSDEQVQNDIENTEPVSDIKDTDATSNQTEHESPEESATDSTETNTEEHANVKELTFESGRHAAKAKTNKPSKGKHVSKTETDDNSSNESSDSGLPKHDSSAPQIESLEDFYAEFANQSYDYDDFDLNEDPDDYASYTERINKASNTRYTYPKADSPRKLSYKQTTYIAIAAISIFVLLLLVLIITLISTGGAEIKASDDTVSPKIEQSVQEWTEKINAVIIDSDISNREGLLALFDTLTDYEQTINLEINASLYKLSDGSNYDTSVLFDAITQKKAAIAAIFEADYSSRLEEYTLPETSVLKTMSTSEVKEIYNSICELYNDIIVEQRIWSGDTEPGSTYDNLITQISDQKEQAESFLGIESKSSSKQYENSYYSTPYFSFTVPTAWYNSGYTWDLGYTTQECPADTVDLYYFVRTGSSGATGSSFVYVLAPGSSAPSSSEFPTTTLLGTTSEGYLIYTNESGTGFFKANPAPSVTFF